jgi:hypothetical protein
MLSEGKEIKNAAPCASAPHTVSTRRWDVGWVVFLGERKMGQVKHQLDR